MADTAETLSSGSESYGSLFLTCGRLSAPSHLPGKFVMDSNGTIVVHGHHLTSISITCQAYRHNLIKSSEMPVSTHLYPEYWVEYWTNSPSLDQGYAGKVILLCASSEVPEKPKHAHGQHYESPWQMACSRGFTCARE